MSAGYSRRPLAEKLGVRAGMCVALINALAGIYEAPDGVIPVEGLEKPLDFIHFFSVQRDELEQRFPALKQALAPDGMLWISWPKKSSKVATDLAENVIRATGLANGLVDVKVAAVDAVWSGLKFVYRLKDR